MKAHALRYRSKNVVQVAANPRKFRIESEQNGEKQLAPFCYNLSLFSGLRRLRQVLVNLVARFASRGSPVRSRSRPPTKFPLSQHVMRLFPFYDCPLISVHSVQLSHYVVLGDRIRTRLARLLRDAFQVPREDGSRVQTSFAACAPSRSY